MKIRLESLFPPSVLWFAGVHNEHAIAGHTCISYTVSRMRVRVMSGYSGMPHKHISLAGTNASLGKRAPTPSRTASVSHGDFYPVPRPFLLSSAFPPSLRQQPSFPWQRGFRVTRKHRGETQ